MRGPSRYFNYCNLRIFNDCLEDLGFSRISIAFFKGCESICIHMRLTMTVGYTCSPWVSIPGFVIVCLTLKFDCWPFRMEVESITHILLWTINHLCWPLFIVFCFFCRIRAKSQFKGYLSISFALDSLLHVCFNVCKMGYRNSTKGGGKQACGYIYSSN